MNRKGIVSHKKIVLDQTDKFVIAKKAQIIIDHLNFLYFIKMLRDDNQSVRRYHHFYREILKMVEV